MMTAEPRMGGTSPAEEEPTMGTSAAEQEPKMGASPADVLACGSAWLSASVVVADVSVSRAFAASSSAFLAASDFF